MYIKGPFTLGTFYKDIIKEELNVKELIFTEDVRDFTTYLFKPQLRTVGPKYGKCLGVIKKYLEGLDGNEAMDELTKTGRIQFQADKTEVELTKEDLLIEMSQKEGYVSESSNKITVVLDTNLTEDLVEEGFVYEIISKIQTMRKDADFDVVDRIHVGITGNEKIWSIVERNKESIAEKVLADSVKEGIVGNLQKEWNINGETALLSVDRVSP